MELLERIFKDLNGNADFIKELTKCKSKKDLWTFHLGIGMYIRNAYIYGKDINYELLSKYYNKTHIDDISSAIITDFFAVTTKTLNG